MWDMVSWHGDDELMVGLEILKVFSHLNDTTINAVRDLPKTQVRNFPNIFSRLLLSCVCELYVCRKGMTFCDKNAIIMSSSSCDN